MLTSSEWVAAMIMSASRAPPGPARRDSWQTRNPLHIQRIGGTAHQIGVVVDHGDIVAFSPTDGARSASRPGRAANDDLHV